MSYTLPALLVLAAGCSRGTVVDLSGDDDVSVVAEYSQALSQQERETLTLRLDGAQPTPVMTVDGAEVTLTATGVDASLAVEWMDGATRPGQLSVHAVQRWRRTGAPAQPHFDIAPIGTRGQEFAMVEAAPRPSVQWMAPDWLEPERVGELPEPPEGLTAMLNCPTHRSDCEVLLLHPPFIMGDVVKSLGRVVGEEGTSRPPQLPVRLKEDATAALATFTTDNVGERIAIVVDGELLTAPSIAEPLTGGQVQVVLGPDGGLQQRIHASSLSVQRTGFRVQP